MCMSLSFFFSRVEFYKNMIAAKELQKQIWRFFMNYILSSFIFRVVSYSENLNNSNSNQRLLQDNLRITLNALFAHWVLANYSPFMIQSVAVGPKENLKLGKFTLGPPISIFVLFPAMEARKLENIFLK